MDIFSQGRKDPQEVEPDCLGPCANENCVNLIFVGEKNWEFEFEWFCSPYCLSEFIGATYKEVEIIGGYYDI